MNATQPNEARELLKRLEADTLVFRCYTEPLIKEVRAYLARTEPQHPAKVAFEEWWASSPSPELASSKPDCQRAALAFWRKGMEHAARLLYLESECAIGCVSIHPRQILKAAGEVPQ